MDDYCCDECREMIERDYDKSNDRYEYGIRFAGWYEENEYRKIKFCPFCGRNLKQ